MAKKAVPTHDRAELLAKYEASATLYGRVAEAVASVLGRTLPLKAVVATTARVKDFDSFYEKANRLVDGSFKYPDPMREIRDLVGLRVVVIAQRHVGEVCELIRKSLDVVEEEDKAAKLLQSGQLGYESYHLICRLGDKRAGLAEYEGLCGCLCEIQVRTALQHAWAENEHRIQYKKSKEPELTKRFLRLAAAVSAADEEFDRIYEINEKLEANAKAAEGEAAADVDDAEDEQSSGNDSVLSQVSRLFGKRPSQLLSERRFTEAIQVYDRFIALQPNQVSHYVGRSKARALSGDIDGGLADKARAEELAPEHHSTRALHRFFERLMRDIEEAGTPG